MIAQGKDHIELARAMVPLSAPRRVNNLAWAALTVAMMPARFGFDFLDAFAREYSRRVFCKGGLCDDRR